MLDGHAVFHFCVFMRPVIRQYFVTPSAPFSFLGEGVLRRMRGDVDGFSLSSVILRVPEKLMVPMLFRGARELIEGCLKRIVPGSFL